MLVAMLFVAAFFGGMAAQKQFDAPMPLGKDYGSRFRVETMKLRDGSQWIRVIDEKSSPEDGYLWWDGKLRRLRPMIDGKG